MILKILLEAKVAINSQNNFEKEHIFFQEGLKSQSNYKVMEIKTVVLLTNRGKKYQRELRIRFSLREELHIKRK